MATYYSDQWGNGREYSGICPPNVVQKIYASFTIGTALAADDVIKMARIPAGATVVGGHLRATDIDTGTEELDIDWGYAANGVDNADADAFGDLGVWTGDSNNNFEIGNTYWSAGPKTFAAATDIQLDVNVDAAAGGTGTIWMLLEYVVGSD